ncbi:hypothetical protein PO883_05100 [Massilia sp. DJPM01]|uniref:hypothetical protein n=1 Tax=Massilia sp. DJPM01 TaxID=3024404 RepID=UPI00259E365F|nr:hypothetical protein [Massilia sp. DJPM01]MDM5176572.1 hypothetical protein [Massilia sp. DJPM01]
MLIDNCSAAGVSVYLIGGALKLRGTAKAVNAMADKVRANKVALLAHLAGSQDIDLVAEFMEVDGLTLEQAQAMAAISVQPRTQAEWLAMIADLNTLINQYCESAEVSTEAKEQIRAASYSQSLASIPHAIDWFRAELTVSKTHTLKAQND